MLNLDIFSLSWFLSEQYWGKGIRDKGKERDFKQATELASTCLLLGVSTICLSLQASVNRPNGERIAGCFAILGACSGELQGSALLSERHENSGLRFFAFSAVSGLNQYQPGTFCRGGEAPAENRIEGAA